MGWRGMALMPLSTSRYRSSFSLSNALVPLVAFGPMRDDPSANVFPVQKTSAATANRGQTIESKFSADDCSLHSGICPAHSRVSVQLTISLAWQATDLQARAVAAPASDSPAGQTSTPADVSPPSDGVNRLLYSPAAMF